MKFKEFTRAKTLSLANYLSLSNLALANELKSVEFRYISCFEDSVLGSENLIRSEIGSISYVLALLCKYKGAKNEYFNELDEGYLSGECNVGEEEFEELGEWLEDAKNVIIDSSFFAHDDSKMIFELLEILGLDVILADGNISEVKTDGNLAELKELNSFDGSVIYQELSKIPYIKGGQNFAAASRIKDGDMVEICFDDVVIRGKFELDISIKSTVAFVGMDKIYGYNFKLVKVARV